MVFELDLEKMDTLWKCRGWGRDILHRKNIVNQGPEATIQAMVGLEEIGYVWALSGQVVETELFFFSFLPPFSFFPVCFFTS